MKYIVVLLLVLVGGFFLPGLLIPDGIDQFEGEDRRRAESALLGAQPRQWTDDLALPDPQQYVARRAARVEDVGYCGHLTEKELRDVFGDSAVMSVSERVRELEAEFDAPVDTMLDGESYFRVQLYTMFGIPYATETRECGQP